MRGLGGKGIMGLRVLRGEGIKWVRDRGDREIVR